MYDSPERMSMARDEHISMDFDAFRPHLGMSSHKSYNVCRILLTVMASPTADSNRYFSFPSFENWEPNPMEEEGEGEMKSP